MTRLLLCASAVCFLACASGPVVTTNGSPTLTLPPGVEAISLLGDTLRTLPLNAATRALYEKDLRVAQAAFDHTPTNADSIVWLGRRIAYLGRFRESIEVYSRGVALHPDNPWLYRHRGHRYLSVRDFPAAIADFERGAKLVEGKPDEVEPDGQPNAARAPIGTLQSNIAYHRGLAYYLTGDYARALPIYQRELASAQNDSRRVSVAYWLYLTLRKLGRNAEATEVLRPFNADTRVVENAHYLRLLRMFKGDLPIDSVATVGPTGQMQVTEATAAYGVASWHALNGRPAEAERLYKELIAGGQWGAFGYIAAEVELARASRPR